jgi:hypothetical protein
MAGPVGGVPGRALPLGVVAHLAGAALRAANAEVAAVPLNSGDHSRQHRVGSRIRATALTVDNDRPRKRRRFRVRRVQLTIDSEAARRR